MERSPLSPSEWQIFQIVSSADPTAGATATWIHEQLKGRGSQISFSTVNAFIARIRDKGWVRVVQFEGGRRSAHHFFPAVSYDEALQNLLERFLKEHSLTPQALIDALTRSPIST